MFTWLLCGAGLASSRIARAPLAAWPVALGSLAIVFSYFIAPAMNGDDRAADFVRAVLAQVKPGEELALVAYKEQFLLYLDRPTVNFGHRRWLEGPQESYDAAAWLNAAPHRVLLVPADNSEAVPVFPRERDGCRTQLRRRLVLGARSGGAGLRASRAMQRALSHYASQVR